MEARSGFCRRTGPGDEAPGDGVARDGVAGDGGRDCG